jgi:hypothetical protein
MSLTLIKSTGTNFTANTVSIATNYNGNIPPIVVNDISTQFNGSTAVFALKQDYNTISGVVDSKDVEVAINGQYLAPYVTELRWPWITPYDAFRGFRINGSNLIIYNAPGVGDTAVVKIVNTSQTVQKRRYPFSASTIALGD